MAERGKRNRDKEPPWLALTALVVALFGGVPGLISVLDFLKRNSLAVHFDAGKALACPLGINDARHTNKLTMVFHNLTVAGRGLQPSYIREVTLEGRFDGAWALAWHIRPKLFHGSNDFGSFTNAAHLRPTTVPGDTIVLMNWQDITYGVKGLTYGEPLSFSYAAVFDVDVKRLDRCDKLRFTVIDYLGRRYRKVVPVPNSMRYRIGDWQLVID
jgi:hypothetical protein